MYSNSFWKQVNSNVKGASQVNLNTGWLSKFDIDLPDMQEQKYRISVLDKCKVIIEQREEELKVLDDLIKARFVEMFGTLHDNENGFEVVTIENVCSLIKDGTQRNDILMSKNGVNYGVAAVNDTDEVFDIYVSLALLRPKKIIDPVFFRCVINNPETKRQFDSSIKGIGVPNLHLGEIKKTQILLPPKELQKEFVVFVEQVDKSKVEIQKALDKTQMLFDSLMQQYFG